MIKRLLKLIILFFILSTGAKGQDFTLNFIPSVNDLPLQQNKNYFLQALNDSVSIETFRFYISNVTLLKNGKRIYAAKGQFYLLDLENKLKIILSNSSVLHADAVQFNIGIDSTTNVAGALGGDLDPAKGMYWAWQSGYINFKLEGTSKVCPTRNSIFQFHIGGYSAPYNSLQTLTLPLNSTGNTDILIDLHEFINAIDLKTNNEIMSPGAKAMKMASLFKTVFKAKP